MRTCPARGRSAFQGTLDAGKRGRSPPRNKTVSTRGDAALTIVQLTNSTNRSGGTRQALVLARGLQERGHRVMVCGAEGGWLLREARQAGLETVPLAFEGLTRIWGCSRTLRRLAVEAGVDVIHAHHNQGHILALLSTVGGGFPPVVANRGVLFRPEFPAKFRSQRTAAIITNSQAVKGVLTAVGVPAAKIHVVPNAKELPDLERLRSRLPALRRELRLEGEGPVVGAVGSGRAEKGFQFLVDAAPAILRRFPRAAFVLVGSGTGRLEPQLAGLSITEHFRLPGHRADAVDLMGLFDVLAFPSIGMDSCPNVVLEAMGVGLPVVGAAVGGVPEMVEEGVTGRLVPPGDAARLAEALIEVVGSPEEARVMGERGRQTLRRRFSLAAKVEATLAVYREVLLP